ncbi:M56 family metallopeptidase [Kaistella sp.]|uniref:M56 family metallopeptidase n=1 Tax=Kaistella sp. TaxID=2782235 RepID=UPI003C48D53D
METILLYFGKVILCSGVTFLYYRLFLKDKTFHHYNRFYLLAAILISLLLPLLKVNYFTLEVNSDIYLLINKLQNFNTTTPFKNDFTYFKICAFLIGLVAVFFLTKLIFGLVKIQILKKKFNKESFEGISFYQTDLTEAPFSFFKNLFWKNSIEIQSDLGRQILKHEMVHIEQKHSWDKIFIEIITSLFWFNPFFYLIKKEINLIHEYLADKKAIQNSDTKAFAQMLLASHFSGKELQATSPFLSSNLKKRLTMLKKSKTKFGYARKILALPLLFTLAFMYLVNAKNKEIKITNLEISELISEMKKDSLSAKNSSLKKDQVSIDKSNKNTDLKIMENPLTSNEITYGIDGTELYNKHPQLFISNDTINKEGMKKLQNVIHEKNNAISPLKESLKLKSDEARNLSKEVRKKSDELRKLSLNKDFDNPEFKKLELGINELGLQINNIFNSDDFKKMEIHYKEMDGLYAQVDKYYNSKEFKDQIKRSEERAKEIERKFNSPEYQKRMKDAEKRAEEAEKGINSPEFQKRIKDAEENTNIGSKNISNIIFLQRNNGTSPNESTKIYIDGKLVANTEFKALSPDLIEKIFINKKNHNGNLNDEIRIITKK